MKKSLLFLSLSLSIAFGEEAQKLKFDLEVGKKYITTQEMQTDMEMKNPMTQEAMKVSSAMTIESSMDVVKDPKGEKVTVAIDRFAMKTSTAGMDMEYDSADESTHNGPMAGMMQGLVGMSSGAIFDHEGSLVETLEAEENPVAKQVGVNSNQFIEALEQSLKMFPDKALKVGDTWDVESEMSMGGIAEDKVAVSSSYKLDGYEDLGGKTHAKISFTAKMDGSVGMGGMAMEIKTEKFAGVMWHDTELNMTRKSEIEMKMSMNVPEGTEMGAGALGNIPYTMKITQELKSVE